MRRRNATTEFLKECIADALLKLLEKGRSLDEITIQEMTDMADVGRVTYYRNFKSKEDVLDFKFSLLERQWLDERAPIGLQDINQISTDWFQFISSIRNTLEILYRAGLEHLALNNFFTIGIAQLNAFYGNPSEREAKDQSAPSVYANVFLVFGLCGMTNEWIHRSFKESPEEMGNMFPMELPRKFQITKNKPR